MIEKIEVRKELTPERLCEVLDYNALTGYFTYLVRAARRSRIGDIAGSVNNEGYRHIRVDGRAYKAHRLAFLYMTGRWPKEMVDHIDGKRDHNAWENLREATRSQNLANSKIDRNGKASRKGVRRTTTGRWCARIQVNKVPKFLGYFSTENAAVEAYEKAAGELFGPFARKAAA